MLTKAESAELQKLEASMDRLDNCDDEEIEPEEYQRIFLSMVELREKAAKENQ